MERYVIRFPRCVAARLRVYHDLFYTAFASLFQTRAFGTMNPYTMTNRPPVGFLPRSESPAVFFWVYTTRSRAPLLFLAPFVLPFCSRRIHFLQDSTWGSIDPRDHTCDWVRFPPPSLRFLMAQGRIDQASETLVKLCSRPEHEAQDGPLLQVRFLLFCHSLSLRTQLVPGSRIFAFQFFDNFLCLSPLLLSFSGRPIFILVALIRPWRCSPVHQ